MRYKDENWKAFAWDDTHICILTYLDNSGNEDQTIVEI